MARADETSGGAVRHGVIVTLVWTANIDRIEQVIAVSSFELPPGDDREIHEWVAMYRIRVGATEAHYKAF